LAVPRAVECVFPSQPRDQLAVASCYTLACRAVGFPKKHTPYVPRHLEEHPDASQIVVLSTLQGFEKYGSVLRSAQIRGSARQPPSQTGCFGRAAPQLACFEVPTGTITTPAKHPRQGLYKTLVTADRPLRCGGRSDVYFDDE
jgi:hypothetical protein